MTTQYVPAPRGSALFVALTFSFLLATLVAVLVQNVMSENMGTDSMILDAQARYLAESGSEYAIRQLKVKVANNYPLPLGANTIVLNDVVPGYEPAADGKPPKPTINYKAVRIEATPIRTTVDGDGVTHTYQRYAVTGRGWVPDPTNPSRFGEVYVNKMVDLDMVPLFQYLAFYNRFDLEMLPGNTQNLKGRIHSNRDIYMGAEVGASLTINSGSVKAAGTVQRHRKDAPTTASNYPMKGDVRIRVQTVPDTAAVNDKNYPILPAQGNLKTPGGTTVPLSLAPTGYDSNFGGIDANNDGDVTDAGDMPGFADGVQSLYGGTVQVGANGVPVMEAPTDISAYRAPQSGEKATHKFNPTTKTWEPATTDATSVPGYYLNNAQLVLASNGSKVQLKNSSGTVLFEQNGGTVTTNLLTDSAGKAVVPFAEKQMFDGREYNSATDGATNGMVKVLEIDMAKFDSALVSGAPVFPATGSTGTLMYAYRTDTNVVSPNGIRIVNGSKLNNALTFVSENPLYVKGDFNTVANGKQPCVLMGDSVNILSNQWNDSKTKSSGLPQPTGDMEFNAAVMAGAYETRAANGTASGTYNGGFENFVRLHEDWSGAGKTLKIRGAFVSLFTSAFAQGKWGGNYTPPKRDWNFDTDFLNTAKWPPGFPCAVGETRVVWWRGRQLDWWPLN
ncbi:MAG TPA: hypothetical protein VGP72_10580 [Planctomycetota bacterium]|jgi:hypothetical protein